MWYLFCRADKPRPFGVIQRAGPVPPGGGKPLEREGRPISICRVWDPTDIPNEARMIGEGGGKARAYVQNDIADGPCGEKGGGKKSVRLESPNLRWELDRVVRLPKHNQGTLQHYRLCLFDKEGCGRSPQPLFFTIFVVYLLIEIGSKNLPQTVAGPPMSLAEANHLKEWDAKPSA